MTLEPNETDFRAMQDSSMTVLTPLSDAGRAWCEEHLPEDCPMWGREGYAIENNYFEPIYNGIIADGLEVAL